jgi:hypothetical protein
MRETNIKRFSFSKSEIQYTMLKLLADTRKIPDDKKFEKVNFNWDVEVDYGGDNGEGLSSTEVKGLTIEAIEIVSKEESICQT